MKHRATEQQRTGGNIGHLSSLLLCCSVFHFSTDLIENCARHTKFYSFVSQSVKELWFCFKQAWFEKVVFAVCFFLFMLHVEAATSQINPASNPQGNHSSNAPQKVTRKDKQEKKVEDQKGEKQGGGLAGMLGPQDNQEKSPILIKADSLTLQSKERIFTYKGNVEIKRGDLFITSDVAIGTYDEQNRLKKIVCEKNVVITRGENMRANSEKAAYHVDTAVIELTENPELSHNGSTLTADKVLVYVEEDRSEAQGEVRVKVLNTEDRNKKSPGSAQETRKAVSSSKTSDTSNL